MGGEPNEVQCPVEQQPAGGQPEENRALLDALMTGQVMSVFEKLQLDQEPTVRPVPSEVRGFRVRLDLHGAKPECCTVEETSTSMSKCLADVRRACGE